MSSGEKFEKRWYQEECVDALSNDILNQPEGKKIHPIAVIPTGAGKSVILTKVIDRYLTERPHKDVLVVSHVSEILEQNYSRIEDYFGDDFLGLYSAGLDSREIKKITVAGIQSIYRKWEQFQNVGLIIVDECHMINSSDQGMYRSFLSKIDAVCCGLTATPFRTGQGYIYKDYSHIKGKKIRNIFNKLSYDLSSYENYNRLIDEGYLVNIIPAPTDYVMDTTGISVVGGDFATDELSARFDREEITELICDKVIKYAGKKYKKWLIFAIDINHANHVVEVLRRKGVSCESVHSDMDADKKTVLDDFRSGKLTALVNVNMLTTGLDIPAIDMIVHLRASKSPIYYVQSNGRGGRPCKETGKTHCLSLDFAGNIAYHGPINDVNIVEPTSKRVTGNPPPRYKVCDNCGTGNALRAKECIACGDEFEINHNLLGDIDPTSTLIKRNVLEKWCNVDDVSYTVHSKRGSPSCLRVMYKCGPLNTFSDWVHIEHSGYARARAIKWVKNRWMGSGAYPDNLGDIMKNKDKLKKPGRILVNLDGKYAEIKDYDFSFSPPERNQAPDIDFEDDIPF